MCYISGEYNSRENYSCGEFIIQRENHVMWEIKFIIFRQNLYMIMYESMFYVYSIPQGL